MGNFGGLRIFGGVALRDKSRKIGAEISIGFGPTQNRLIRRHISLLSSGDSAQRIVSPVDGNAQTRQQEPHPSRSGSSSFQRHRRAQ